MTKNEYYLEVLFITYRKDDSHSGPFGERALDLYLPVMIGYNLVYHC